MDEEKLINLVRSHECIYDVSSRFYMDQHMKRNAWQKIAEEMNKTRKLFFYLFIVRNRN